MPSKKIILIDCESIPSNATDHGYVTISEPFGVLCLEAYLQEHGIDCFAIRLPLTEENWQLIAQSEIVGLSGLTYNWLQMKATAAEIRQRFLGKIIVAGREHVTCLPEEVLEKSDIDVVVQGPGEIPLLKLVQGLSREELPSAGYLGSDGKLVVNERTTVQPDFTNIRLDRRPEWMNTIYPEMKKFFPKMAAVLLQRGCPFDCSFCTNRAMWGKYNQYRDADIEGIIAEIRHVQENYGIEFFALQDLMANANLKKLHAFARRIIKEGIEAKFFALFSAINGAHDFDLLRRAGFLQIAVGVESPTARKEVGKGKDFGFASQFMQRIADAGILTRVYFIIGFPWEKNVDELVNIYKWALQNIPVDSLRVHFLTSFPGTESWSDQEQWKHNVYKDEDEAGYQHYTTMEPIFDFGITPEKLLKVRQTILRNYYQSPEFAALVRKRKGQGRLVGQISKSYADYTLNIK